MKMVVPAQAYLDRLGYQGPLTPGSEVLRSLHRAHMFAVPFENLDIGLGRQIVCDESRFLHKIVNERRGGFCYEMNGAFAALLRELGFQVTLLSARVSGDDGSDGPEFDHLALRVELEQPWLADVGFGDSFVEPLRLEPGLEQEQFGRRYRITAGESGLHLEANADGTWKKQYVFTLQPRQLSEFAAMCHYHQTSPDSPFTRKRVCSLATPAGRITVSGDKLIETSNGVREERVLQQDERRAILLERFGVSLPG
ncbi:MAG: arylamine N-acetyltransferase [Terriglobales bacterium]